MRCPSAGCVKLPRATQTSSDGYAWARANLGQVCFEGAGTANSLLGAGIKGATGVFSHRP